MAVRPAFGDSLTYYRTRVGEDAIDLGQAKVVEPSPPKLESPETSANRERVTRNLQGKAR